MKSLQLEIINEKLLTPDEYSQKYKIPLRTVYYHIQNNTLKTVIFKGKKLIDMRN